MAVPTSSIDRQSWLLLLLLSVLWGGSFFFTGVAVRELPPLTIVMVRVTLGAALLLSVIHVAGGSLPKTVAGWRPFLVMGLLNNIIPFSLMARGTGRVYAVAAQMYISSGLASVLNATTPLFTVLVLASFGDERLTARRIVGVMVGLAGVAILRGPAFGDAQSQTIGLLLCLGGTLSYGFSGL